MNYGILTDMALVIMRDNTKKKVSQDIALKMWWVKRGQRQATMQQKLFVKHIQHIYLDWHSAPDEYIKQNLDSIIPQAIDEWAADPKGKPTRPATPEAWRFARKWNLWIAGQPSFKVKHFIQTGKLPDEQVTLWPGNS